MLGGKKSFLKPLIDRSYILFTIHIIISIITFKKVDDKLISNVKTRNKEFVETLKEYCQPHLSYAGNNHTHIHTLKKNKTILLSC